MTSTITYILLAIIAIAAVFLIVKKLTGCLIKVVVAIIVLAALMLAYFHFFAN